MFLLHTSKSGLETEVNYPNHKQPIFRLGRISGSHDNPIKRDSIKFYSRFFELDFNINKRKLTHTTSLSSSLPARWRHKGTLRPGLLMKATWQCWSSDPCLVATSWHSFQTFSSLENYMLFIDWSFHLNFLEKLYIVPVNYHIFFKTFLENLFLLKYGKGYKVYH